MRARSPQHHVTQVTQCCDEQVVGAEPALLVDQGLVCSLKAWLLFWAAER